MSLDKLRDAAKLLQEADVSKIILSLALGIAEAQEKLDQNSVKQVLVLANPDNGIGGKSLLELGFTPAFYHLQYADISASITLKVKESESFSIGVEIEADFQKRFGESKERLDFLHENDQAAYKSEYTCAREVFMKARSNEAVQIEGTYYTLNHTQGLHREVERIADELRQKENIERVRTGVSTVAKLKVANQQNLIFRDNVGGYMTVHFLPTHADLGILQIAAPESTANGPITLATNTTLAISPEFTDTMATAHAAMQAGTVVGFSKEKIWVNGSAGVEMRFFFDFDKDTLDTGVTGNEQAFAHLGYLALLLRLVPGIKVNIFGYADQSGKPGYNDDLSYRRAKSVEQWLVSHGVQITQMTTEGKGESGPAGQNAEHRKVTLALASAVSYIYFEGGPFDKAHASPIPTATSNSNRFVYLEDGANAQPPTTYAATFEVSPSVTASASGNTLAEFATDFDTALTDYKAEVIHDIVYLSHRDTAVKFMLLSQSKEDIKAASTQQTESSASGTESAHFIGISENSKTRLQKESEKIQNPGVFGISGRIDFRMSKQFELSMEGNCTVSTRLVSLPAPPEFLDHIKNYLG